MDGLDVVEQMRVVAADLPPFAAAGGGATPVNAAEENLRSVSVAFHRVSLGACFLIQFVTQAIASFQVLCACLLWLERMLPQGDAFSVVSGCNVVV